MSALPLESPLERFSRLPRDEREALIAEEARKASLRPNELKAMLLRSWRFVGRPKQQPPPGAWTYWFLNCGRGFGKAACVETPIPTPAGWKRLGDIEVGDEVFDESGRPSRVEATYDRDPDVAYRLWFSDGSHVDVCSEHLWTTWLHRDRKALGRSTDAGTALPPEWPGWRSRRGAGPRVRTTEEIAATLTQGRRGDLNHSVPVCGPLDLPEVDLPLDPYILGAWLGDGSKNGSNFTAAVEDQPHWYAALAAFSPHPIKDPITVATYGLHIVLRGMGLLRNKHVPAAYLRASSGQRLALLQGLMDTDGSAAPSSVEFSNTNYLLVRAVVELARSLGQKPVVAESRATLNGRDYGPKWRVTWRPTIPVFRMERKAAIILPLGDQAIRNQHRMIVAAERIDPKPMRCLTVASRHHTFLIGEAMIPTHNTVTGAQWVKEKSLADSRRRIGVIAPTLGDVRATCFEGETGLLSVFPNDALLGQSREVAWNKTLLELTLANGSTMKGFGTEAPDRLRGPQHHYVWGEEVSSWGDAKSGDTLNTSFNNMKLGLRLGENPQAVLTSTPKPNKLTRELLDLAGSGTLILTTGSSFENRANLSEAWWRAVVVPLIGTRTGRQEIEAEFLEDVEGALWSRAVIDASRIAMPEGWQNDVDVREEWLRKMSRVVVGLDPNTTAGESADAAGIVVVGLGFSDRHGYALDDRTTVRGGPRAWAAAAVDAYHDWQADAVVAETNNGGDMVEMVIHGFDRTVRVEKVTASRGKLTRAEPIAALYVADEKHEKVATMHHVGVFSELEDEQTTWVPGEESPNRMDALVWGAWFLKLWKPPAVGRGSHVARGDIPGITEIGAGLSDY